MPPVFEDIAFNIFDGFAPLPVSPPWQLAQLLAHKDLPTKPAACNASAEGVEVVTVVVAGVVVAAAVVVGVVAAVAVVSVAVVVPPPHADNNTAADVAIIRALMPCIILILNIMKLLT